MKPRSCDYLSRRSFVRIGVMGGTGLTLSNLLRLSSASQHSASADACLFLNLAGGPSHLDTLDMKPDGPSETRGEFQPIQSKIAGLPICEHLPKLAGIIDQFTLIRGIQHSAGAHQQGQSYISTGNRPVPAVIYPSFGSVVANEHVVRPDLPPYVAIPTTEWNAGYMGDAFAPLNTNAVPRPGQPFEVRGISLAEGLTVEKVQRRNKLLGRLDTTFREIDTGSQLLEAVDKFGEQAREMITSAHARAAFDVDREPRNIRQQFGADEFSQSLLLACRLIEFGVRFVTVTFKGWDTHLDNFNGHRKLMAQLDPGLQALMSVMRAKGLLDRTLVVAMGEFGRTPKINANTGRDHYPQANWCLMTGGGIQPAQLIGGTDKGGTGPDAGTNITPDDLAATLYHALGIDPEKEYYTKSARPVMLVPEGRIMTELFS